VRHGDGRLADVAGAILDGGVVDWPSVESSVDADDLALVAQLKLLAGVADVHRFTAAVEPGDHWAHLRVMERLGAGANGVVYRAWDDRLDREVALKLLSTRETATGDTADAFIEEGRLLARVRHPNVATIYGADRIGGTVGLWMELVPGRTLEQLLDDGREFGAGDAVRIGVELCHAVSAVHDAGLLHRDIKAQNVMLTDAGRVVLMDFGTGREVGDGSLGRVAGTPLYLAPELLSGAPATVQTDIYSLGVLLYHLVTRAYPVSASSLRELRGRHERGERTLIRDTRPDLPRPFARAIETSIDVASDRRFQTAAAMAAALSKARPASWRTRLTYAAAATLVVSSVGAATLLSRPGTSAATMAPPAARTRPIIAVLPLQNLSAEPDSEYFVDGLTDEIIRNLAVIDGLDVRSRTSSFYFKGKPRNLSDVGHQLGVSLIVEGSVLRDGGRLRINAQLVQVDGDVPLWSQRFDRHLDDVFVVQDEISRAIVNRLRLTIGQGQRRYDGDGELYAQYLMARGRLERRRIGSEAAELAGTFEGIIEKDRTFAPAYAGLATALAYVTQSPYTPSGIDRAHERLQQAAATALELDPLLPEAHAAMGWALARRFEWADAEKSFTRALQLSPSTTATAVNFSYSTLRALGKLDEAERLIREGMRHDPLSGDGPRELLFILIQAGRFAEAIAHAEATWTKDAIRGDPRVERDLARALTFMGRHEEVLTLASLPGSGLPSRGARQWTALAFVQAGRRDAVERMAAEEHGFPFRLALIHAALGDRARTLDALEAMFASEPQRIAAFLMQPELAMLRTEPRWLALRRKLKLPVQANP